MMFKEKVLLDSCALLWLASGDKCLRKEVLSVIENASIVLVSAISAWEISLKVSQKKLKLPLPVKVWFSKVIKHHNLIIAPLSLDLLLSVNELPFHHWDPADRFIIATAILENSSIVTADSKFSNYDVDIIF